MPGKARRVASRQAQLGRRRKRQQREHSDLNLTLAAPTNVDGTQDGADHSAVLEPPEAIPAPAPVRTRPERPSPVAARNAAATGITDRFPIRARREAPQTHNYVGAELRRILLLSTAVIAIIIVLGVVL